LAFEFDDGEVWLLEFPASIVDGDVSSIRLSRQDTLYVIRLESLVVDRVLQATDGTTVTFEEAVRLGVAVFDDLDWEWVGEETGRRSALEPGLALDDVYSLIVAEARSLLGV
jgi:hypothetical protein